METEREIVPSEDYTIEEKDGVKLVLSRKHGAYHRSEERSNWPRREGSEYLYAAGYRLED